tara:strand:+ start:25 stop:456 length:432 start_codon:yes stop_codon:yes gene_type:complete
MPYGKPPSKLEMKAYRKAQKAVMEDPKKLEKVQVAFRKKHDYQGTKKTSVSKPKPKEKPNKEKGLKDQSVATLNLIIKHYDGSSFNVDKDDKFYKSQKKEAKTKRDKIKFIEFFVDRPDAIMKTMRRTWSDFLPDKVGWWQNA